MNRFTLTLHRVIHQALSSLKHLTQRLAGLFTGRAHDPAPGPQWQQLELPFSRTPVKRWNR